MTTIALISLIITLVGVGVKIATTVVAAQQIGSLSAALSVDNLDNIKGFDEVYINLAGQAGNMLLFFIQLATMIVYVCAFLCLVFNAFKLWAGTAEIKKIFVDTIYKCVMVMALMFVYPSVVEKVYTVGTEIGVQMAGGEKSITAAFANIAETTKGMLDKGLEPVIEIAKSGAYDVNGELTVTTDTLKELTSSSGLTKDQLIEYARANGLNVIDKNDANYEVVKANVKKTKSNVKNFVKANKKNIKENKKIIAQNMKIVEALTRLYTGESIDGSDSEDVDENSTSVSTTDILSLSKDTANKIYYNPYIGDSKRLSMSTLMKTAVVVSEICAEGFDSKLPSSDGSWEQVVSDIATAGISVALKFFLKIGMKFLYRILILAAVVLLGIEYVISVIEYLIVCAISAFLIPLLFIDATKQFATNILKMLLTYFVKIVVTTMMCFFVTALFINATCDLITMDLSSSITFLYYIYIICLGMTLAKASGKIASAVVSGNHSMGVGDIVNEFKGMTHAAHVGMHHAQQTAHKVVDGAKTAYSGGQDIAKKQMVYNDGKQSAAAAGEKRFADTFSAKGGLEGGGGDWLQSMGYDRSESGMMQAQKDAGNAAKKAFAHDFNKQTMRDWGFKKLTGTDAYHKQNKDGSFDGNLLHGQEFYDATTQSTKKATWEDVRNAVKYRGGQNAANSVDQWGNKKLTAQDRLNKVRAKMGKPVLPPNYER